MSIDCSTSVGALSIHSGGWTGWVGTAESAPDADCAGQVLQFAEAGDEAWIDTDGDGADDRGPGF